MKLTPEIIRLFLHYLLFPPLPKAPCNPANKEFKGRQTSSGKTLLLPVLQVATPWFCHPLQQLQLAESEVTFLWRITNCHCSKHFISILSTQIAAENQQISL